jgi:xanthine dehydrogenase accessory factor
VLAAFVDADVRLHLEIFRQALETLSDSKKAWLITTLPQANACEHSLQRWLIQHDGTVTGEAHSDLAVSVGHGSPIKLFDAHPDRSQPSVDLASIRQPVLVDTATRRFLIEPVFGYGTAYIFGAGHVSQCLAPLCHLVGFITVVLDDRHQYANSQRFPTAGRTIVVDSFGDAFRTLTIREDSYVVIVTRGHAHDRTVLAQALRTDAGYIGMIGSVHKRDVVYRALAERGFGSRDFARVHSPIGLAIGAESPEEIAVSIVAEMVQVRARPT